MHASLHIFPCKEKMTKKFLTQISKSQYIEIKSAWKEENELLHKTSRFLDIELWELKVHVGRVILCTAHALMQKTVQRAFLSFLICCIS